MLIWFSVALDNVIDRTVSTDSSVCSSDEIRLRAERGNIPNA